MTTDPQTVTVRVPFTIRRRGGRKLIIGPSAGETSVIARHRVDNTIVKALARGFRWRKLLESGAYQSIEEMAAAEKINSTYVARLLRMTLLAPDTIETLLDGRQSVEVTLAELMKPFPATWRNQNAFSKRPERSDSSETGRAKR
jgi:hypothetical protein